MPNYKTTIRGLAAQYIGETNSWDAAEEFLWHTGARETLRPLLRIGQAFHNGLTHADQMYLTGTQYDPFYEDTWLSVEGALDFLTHPKRDALVRQ